MSGVEQSVFTVLGLGKVIGIGLAQPGFEVDPGFPAQLFEAAAVHQLLGRAVRLAGVKVKFAGVAHHLGDQLGGFLDGEVAAVAHVDVAEHGLGVGVVGGFVQVHHKDAGGGHVVYMQEFAVGRTGAPEGDGGFGGNPTVDRVKADHFADVSRDFAVAGAVCFDGGDVAGLGQLGEVQPADHG